MKKIQINKNNNSYVTFNISTNLINSSEKLKNLYKNIGNKEIIITTITDVDTLFFEKFLEYYDKKHINYDINEITNKFVNEQKQYIIDLILFLDNYKFTEITEIVKTKITDIFINEPIENIRSFLNLEDDLSKIEKDILNNDIKNISNNFNDLLFFANLNELNSNELNSNSQNSNSQNSNSQNSNS